MKSLATISLKDVQAVYGGPEGDLWELVMGQQVHIGGFQSSMDLAERAGVGPGMSGVDLCCCNGAGMRFLVRFRNVDRMRGVDATANKIAQGRFVARKNKCVSLSICGRDFFRSSVTQKITSSNAAVPMTSAPKAASEDMRWRTSGVSGCPPGLG
jgi:hypothetical protein